MLVDRTGMIGSSNAVSKASVAHDPNEPSPSLNPSPSTPHRRSTTPAKVEGQQGRKGFGEVDSQSKSAVPSVIALRVSTAGLRNSPESLENMKFLEIRNE